MTRPANVAYLTALLDQSQQREARHETVLARATNRPDTQAAIYRLEKEQAQARELAAALLALTAFS